MRLRMLKDTAKELGIDPNEARFLIQWALGEWSFVGDKRVREHTYRVGQSRVIDEILFLKLKYMLPNFIQGREIYRDSPMIDPQQKGDI